MDQGRRCELLTFRSELISMHVFPSSRYKTSTQFYCLEPTPMLRAYCDSSYGTTARTVCVQRQN
jgi:hypothetical protein